MASTRGDTTRTKNEIDESRLSKKHKIIEEKARAEIIIALRTISMLKMKHLAGRSICNEFIDIVKDAEFDLNIFLTRIKDVEGCRVRPQLLSDENQGC